MPDTVRPLTVHGDTSFALVPQRDVFSDRVALPVQPGCTIAVSLYYPGGEKVTSTISFHLKELRNAGLITMERRGKHMICAVDRQALAKVGEFFRDALRAAECCPGD